MTRWCFLLALASVSCSDSATPAAASGGGGGGSGEAGFDPFGDASFGGGGGCEAGSDASPASDAGATSCAGLAGGVSWSEDVEPLLHGCTGENCHASPTFDTLVGVAAVECCGTRLLVAPGDPDQSYLVAKLRGHDLCFGAPMPLSKPALPESDIELIVRWICEGAPKN